MSTAERRRTRGPRHLCQRCRDRKARFNYHGVVRADYDQPPSLEQLRRPGTVCFECYRRELNKARARRLAERARMPSPFTASDGGPTRVLDTRQVGHRRRMLEHLEHEASAAS
ncbi:MAG: hypothetical protein A3I61_03765 [Acidobacteria bacterium RIFCSPLOWO2_02_FULL_68_18]|nr:MAG: hypothetical protein A3I61_03765 [Acidobacteria bacterium RIFCSPLOWO2_02_FULL_68_18]OFW52160.1 MAG: hypothetical protein A3G77_08070 [Acidobacteria bacterium RIFCSPLOWO2_12_FULL_68_19]